MSYQPNYSSYYKNKNLREEDSSEDDTELIPANKIQEKEEETSSAKKGLNEALKYALEQAACPGVGDEEPEVLENPNALTEEAKEAAAALEKERELAKEQREAFERKLEEEANKIDFSKLVESYDNQSIRDRSKYIPLRLSYEERKSLRLVCAAINVSDYTTSVDIAFKNKARRHHTQLQYIVAFLTGLIASTNYDYGQDVLENRNFNSYEKLIKVLLEIARRYKITNPEKLRSEYGKLMFLMQDSVSETINSLIGVEIHAKIKTVYSLLEECHGLSLLDDPAINIATEEILPNKNKSRAMIQSEIKKKEKACEYLVKKYTSRSLSGDTIRLCLYSITDNNSFLNSNRKPVLEVIELLKEYFSPDTVESQYSLSIQEGVSGARLSHSHENQYNYVMQSLTLWSEILQDMFRLWYLAEEDLLNKDQPYELTNTGQGLQRLQQSPRVYRAMHEILSNTQKRLGGWVGTSVIHLGDHNVPNALVFIDKYTQVARILGPLVITLRNLELLCDENDGLKTYLKSYGGLEKAKKDILHDFFTHGFDGSGGDNFFDAGSCIDGRLTSAWNWCSQLSSKPYYPLFRLTGFLSFDGQFDNTSN